MTWLICGPILFYDNMTMTCHCSSVNTSGPHDASRGHASLHRTMGTKY